jgi:hypothetical protein
MKKTKCSRAGWLFGVALLGALTGCIGYVDGPRHGDAYVQGPSVEVEAGLAMQDDYVYYPDYQIYYSGNRHQYVYLEGSTWVSRPAPQRVSAEVLFASPSVRLDFHDSPALHHATVVRQYPKHWAPPSRPSPNKAQGNRDNERGTDRGDRR